MTRYELAERIGAGGMAEIFRGKAVAEGGFEKPVAIKRILPHLSQDERFVELLIAEAQILSHLRHRNIVQIFDVGMADDGHYFLVMEYVDGADLGALQRKLEDRRERLPVDLGLHLGAELCDALHFAHCATGPEDVPLRLVHRDVSPSNVLISRSGEVKITDFGIAKRAEEATGHGAVRGKFAYISPEQAMNARVDPRSDVYSIGILMFELLLGARLYSQLSDFDALRAVRQGAVPRPREVDPGVDPKLESILLKALAFDKDDRHQSAADLSKELRSLRYALPATGADPAKALADIVVRFTGRPSEPRITESRFIKLSGDETAALRRKSLAHARQIVDAFEEEETRFIRRIARAERTGPRSADDRARSAATSPARDRIDPSDEDTRILEDPREGIATDGAGEDRDDDEQTQVVSARGVARAGFQPSAAGPPRTTLQGVRAAASLPGVTSARDDGAGPGGDKPAARAPTRPPDPRAHLRDPRARTGQPVARDHRPGLGQGGGRPERDGGGGGGGGNDGRRGERDEPSGPHGRGAARPEQQPASRPQAPVGAVPAQASTPGHHFPPGHSIPPPGPPRRAVGHAGAPLPPAGGPSLPPAGPFGQAPDGYYPPFNPAASHPGINPAASHPGINPAASHPGINPAASHPGINPGFNYGGSLVPSRRRTLGIAFLIVCAVALISVAVVSATMDSGAPIEARDAAAPPAPPPDAGPDAAVEPDASIEATAAGAPRIDKPAKSSRRDRKRDRKQRKRRTR